MLTLTNPCAVRKAALAAAAIAAAALALPAAGQAATSFGSPLTETPNNAGNPNVTQCQNPPQATPCTRVLTALNKSSNFPVTAPADGVVTKFRIKTQSADTVTFRIARLTGPLGQSALGQSVGTGPTVTTQGNQNAIQEFGNARIPVRAGDHVAVDSSDLSAQFGDNGSTKQYQYVPPLVDGQAARTSTENENEELLVQAVIEPDSDKDGFGDETQDQCPTDPSTAGTCPTPDNAAPRLNGVALAPGSFRAAPNGGAVASRAPIGARVFYNLSETATVTWGIEKGTVGRRVGGRCVKRTRGNASQRRCLRFVRLVGSFKTTGGLGQNGFRFSGRLKGKKLALGSYKLVGTAKDPAGNKSKTRKRNFRIVK
jgi:hypothetical protein